MENLLGSAQTLTTGTGRPVPSGEFSLTAGNPGPGLLSDVHYLDKLQHFDRERISERVVHAKGTGAYGYLEVTNKIISQYCKADLFSHVGKKTKAFVRFSQVGGERGASDTERDPRGFACKFYTDEGNWDLVCNNIPIFFFRDPILFPDFIHTQKRNPKTALQDPTAFWDFLSAFPQSVHAVTMIYSDRGIPASYRAMHGFGNHAFRLVNAANEAVWVKFHLISEAGIKTLTSEAAEALRGADPDYLRRDLTEHITKGGTATWKFCVQIIPLAEAASYKFDIFDVTKVVPHGDYPLIEIAKLVLDRMPDNFFCETEQVAFCPANMVPGIEASPDKMLVGRMFSYADTQRYRVGTNFQQLPINMPMCPVMHHQRDGFMAYHNPGAETNYYTGKTASGGPQQVKEARAIESNQPVMGEVGRFDQRPADPDDDFVQARVLYQHVMTNDERARLIANICGHLSQASSRVQKAMVKVFERVDQDYGSRVEDGLKAVKMGSFKPTSSKQPSGQPPKMEEVKVKNGQTPLSRGQTIYDINLQASGGAGGTGNVEAMKSGIPTKGEPNPHGMQDAINQVRDGISNMVTNVIAH